MKRFVNTGVLVGILLTSAVPLMAQAAASPSATAPAAFISLSELQQHFAEKVKKARLAIEAERLAALDAFLKKAPAAEKQATLLAMIESAAILEQADRMIALSEEYLKGTPNGVEAWNVRQVRYMALINSDRLNDAKAEWEKAAAKVDMDAWQQVFDAGVLIADAMQEAGRVEEVKEFYKKLRDKFSFVSNISEVLGPREAALKWLGKPAPALEGADTQGKPLDLAQYKGKVVLIDFWATWCQPCIVAMPGLIETYKTYNKSGFEIIGISLDQDKDALARFLKSQPLPWRIVSDGKGWLSPNARKYEVSGIPATFLVDRDGKIAVVGTPTRGFDAVVKRLLQTSDKKP